ncbi:MAG: phosphate ABC transporter ATP-binding protein [Gemmatimonadales bacterium]
MAPSAATSPGRRTGFVLPERKSTGIEAPARDRITVSNLNAWFGNVHAVRGVSLTVPERRVTAMIGPSGCGKSTFLRTLNRMHETVSGARATGSVLLDGRDVYAKGVNPVQVRRHIGMVFQRPTPFPTMTIRENVAAGLRVLGDDTPNKLATAEIVEKALKRAALWDEVKDRLGTSAMGLSGGQQQRLCIARALATEPEVLLLDEPTASLDPISTQSVEELVWDLRKDFTVVIVTHNMQQAARSGAPALVSCISDGTALIRSGPSDSSRYANLSAS